MNVLLTGGNSGIGHAILNDFLTKKYQVTAVDYQLSKLDAMASPLLTTFKLDLCDIKLLEKWLSSINDVFDVVINCAGIREIKSVLQLETSEWQKVIDINLTAPFLISKHFANNAILGNKAINIINISSISGLQAEPNRAAYCASKHGLIGLTKEMAIELGKYGIRVNSIAPGIIKTELTNEYFSNPEILNLIYKNTPLKSFGNTQNIVSTINFILQNDYITGSTLVVDGGWMAGKEL